MSARAGRCAAPRRIPAGGERLPWRQAARVMLAMGFGSWGLVGLALWWFVG